MKQQIPNVIKPILEETKMSLKKVLKNELKGIILFGSYSRGDYDYYSDIDLLILLNNNKISFQREKYKSIIYDLSLKYDKVISIIPCFYKEYFNKRTPLILNIQKEGLNIWII